MKNVRKVVKSLSFLLSVLLVLLFSGCSTVRTGKDTLFQVSTINALLEGVYDGEVSFQKLKQHGDFGIGTFNALDGEMIAVDGNFFQVKSDGIAYAVKDNMKTPFAAVTYFEHDKSFILKNIRNFAQLEKQIDNVFPTKNIFYAIRIDGVFDYIKTRSVPKQKKPYPLLIEVVKNQPVFEYKNIKGTIAGFWCPAFVKSLNVTGYHFHFIDEDRKAGGHLLECKFKEAKVSIDYTSSFYLVLPESNDFFRKDIQEEKEGQLHKIEKQ